MYEKLAQRFLVGSSALAGLVSFLYIGRGMGNWRRSGRWTTNQFNYFEWMMAFVLIMFGIFNAGIYLLAESELVNLEEYELMFIGGALFGLILSLIGRQFNFPIRVFGFNKGNQLGVHVIAMILYSLIFGVIINYLNTFV